MTSPWLSPLAPSSAPTFDDYRHIAWRLRAKALDAGRKEEKRIKAAADRWAAVARRKFWSDQQRRQGK